MVGLHSTSSALILKSRALILCSQTVFPVFNLWGKFPPQIKKWEKRSGYTRLHMLTIKARLLGHLRTIVIVGCIMQSS